MMFLALFVTLFAGSQSSYAATLADGSYSVDYVIKKPEDESVSMANDYWDKPATVVVSGGAIKVQMTINHSEWVTKFKVLSGSNYVDAKVISTNSEKNTRLVEFSLDSLEKSMLSQIHVTVPEIDYDHDYTIRFVFDTDTLKLISKPASTATPEPTATPKPTALTGSGDKESEATTVKPTDNGKESSKPNKNSASQTPESSSAPTAKPNSTNEATTKPTTEQVNSASSSSGKDSEDGLLKADTEVVVGKDDQSANQPTEQAGNEGESAQSSTDANVEDTAQDGNSTDNQQTVELSAALDGATITDSAIVVAAGVSEDSSNKKSTIMITILSLVLVAGVILVIFYRQRKAKKS